MRHIAAMVVLVLGCSSHGASVEDAAVHLDGLSCMPSDTCATGPMCGTTCCASGEACISGTCTCGGQLCTDGNVCASPVLMLDRCGEICCGKTSECPGVTAR